LSLLDDSGGAYGEFDTYVSDDSMDEDPYAGWAV